METVELIKILSRGEDSKHQFKLDFSNANALAAEMVAFSNSGGGRIFIGVHDSGKVHGLSSEDVARLNQMISNVAGNNVRPAINPITENVSHPNGLVMVLSIPEGFSKPYMVAQDGNLSIWIKKGSDKRRANDREEIQRLFQSAGLVHADEMPVSMLGLADLDIDYFERFYQQQYGETLASSVQALPQLLKNMNLMRDDRLNLTGALLFAKSPEFALPAFSIKAVAYVGNEIEGVEYSDTREIKGKMANMFQQALSFVLANTHAIQGDLGFNTQGQPEIPRIVWEELIANALIHRDYFISAPIRILVFFNRVEIISPGHLPNNLTVENIIAGNSNIRNPIIASFATKLIPYKGLGSGLLRALRAWPDIEFIDDRSGNLFKVIVKRKR